MKKLFLAVLTVSLVLVSCNKNNSQESVNSATASDTTAAATEVKPVKMILDIDTGVDDAMALAYALGNPNIDLIGVTTVYGNVSQKTSAENTLALLDLLNRSDIPVYAGENKPTGSATVYEANQVVIDIHGKNGIGNVEIPKSTRQVEKQSASDFMIESAKKYGKDLYIVAVGPETNLGEVIKKEPKFGDQVGKVVVMGGALIVQGNMTHFAEANIYNDPVAANNVFRSTPLTMVGLDVTMRTLFTKADTQKWRELGTKSGIAYADIVDYYINAYAVIASGLNGCALHDPLAVSVAMNPDFVKTLSLPMQVITDGVDKGRTIAITDKMNDPKAAIVKVAVDVDVETAVNDFNKTLTNLFTKN